MELGVFTVNSSHFLMDNLVVYLASLSPEDRTNSIQTVPTDRGKTLKIFCTLSGVWTGHLLVEVQDYVSYWRNQYSLLSTPSCVS